MHRLGGLAAVAELVAARRTPELGWEIVAVRHGRLVGTDVVPRGVAPLPFVDAMLATAEHVEPAPGPTPAATAEETECVLRWLDQPGTRIVAVSGQWSSPAHGAGAHRERFASVTSAHRDAPSSGGSGTDRRRLRPVG